MQHPLKLGIAGLGTVGAGLLHLLAHQKRHLDRRVGRQIVVAGISARTKAKDRGVDLSNITWFDDPVKLAEDPDIEVFVELIGGADGVAKAAVEAALRAGKHVVTANKALIALHGTEIFAAAAAKGVTVAFEAAVAGGIPIIKALREGLSANRIEWLAGIINGTGNFILSEMRDKGRDFDDVLAEAQALGYAEVDPTFDVEG
ncbi:MAG: homoserine dehydrogenase, partial [Hyphomicrobiaceae bacterium]|nr:homoserine dehydrogenase [Hyphomicrobiaceae bacterium]